MPDIKCTPCPWDIQRSGDHYLGCRFCLSSEGTGLFALDWSKVTQRGVWRGSNELCRGWTELCTAKKRFQLGSLENIIHLSSFSFTQAASCSSALSREAFHQCIPFSFVFLLPQPHTLWVVLVLDKEQISLHSVMERASIWVLYYKFWILCNYFSAGFKIDPYSFAINFDC